ncbi:phosphate ABC transporter permease subunit PstC [Halocella sp. SP3-1]|uniref:phosphate ABC transporter permease subunit PstC n=1 Tax=Halocella sp. SP3-1 TaxID=2382161 RepID=UPI000F755893|nr:phosphate ABC transporter permease subunit PstC [Halocella sp. SP3-1]AZO94727.1 phosphate ABC transporter permease subunit PstC [Halocella sp. SP3-1]
MNLEGIFSFIIKAITFFSIMMLFFIILFITKESIVIFKEVSFFKFVLGTNWNPIGSHPEIAILPMLLATIYVSIIAIIIALPIGVGAAFFLSSVINREYRKIINPLIDILAGIPSVIYGLIGFVVLVRFFESCFSLPSGESILAGGILLSIMILPYIISICTESMLKIQKKYKQSSQALGVSKWYMIRYLILPTAKESIIAGLILALGRAMGETMAVMMVTGNSPILPKLFSRAQTIPSLIALEMGGAQVDSLHYHALFGAGFLLMIVLFIINLIFYWIRKRI